MRIELRWGGGDQAAIQKPAAELVALAPDVLVAGGGAAGELMLKATRTIPIVFVIVPDPVGSGFVETGQFAVIQSVASTVGIEVSPIDLREPAQIERVIASFAQRPNGGIILTGGVTGRPISI